MKIVCLAENGENLYRTIQRMVEIAHNLRLQVTSDFNDIQLVANPGDSEESVMQVYTDELNAQRKNRE